MVEALASNFVKPLLDAHLTKVLNNDFIKRLKLQSNNKTMGKHKEKDLLGFCNKCDLISMNEHGLAIHKGPFTYYVSHRGGGGSQPISDFF